MRYLPKSDSERRQMLDACGAANGEDLFSHLPDAVRLKRPLALDPGILLLEHPTAGVERDRVPALGSRIRAVSERRSAAVVAVTADQVFADALSGRTFQLEPATGRLTERGQNRWFRRRLG